MTKRPPTEAVAATQEEIDEAIEALTPVQLVRLQKIAWLRHRALGRRAAGRHEGDLLSDALIAVLEGRRKWIRDNCDLVAFLAGVMRSIASHIRDGGSADAFDRLAANPRDERHNTGDSMDQMPMPKSDDLEHRLRAAELDGQIRDRFKDDPVVLLVYEAAFGSYEAG